MTNIIIGGDICPMGRVERFFTAGNASAIFHDLLNEIAGADLSVANLECPLISQKTPIIKGDGPVLDADIGCVRGFAASKWTLLNLANNHSFDHGTSGLQETMHAVRHAGMSVVGAGLNLHEAQTPYITQISGQRIVIYAMAEREFSIADEKTPGANPLDLIDFVKAVRSYKKDGLFIVLMHGGKEYYPFPSPEMVKRCRFMVDMGADAVVCCHTHCPLPWEMYCDRPIVYGLGNLVFENSGERPDSWFQGYLAKLTLEDRKLRMEAIPYFQSKTCVGVRKMDGLEQGSFFDDMHRKADALRDSDFLERQWRTHCLQERDGYLLKLFGHKRVVRKMGPPLFSVLHSKRDVLRALYLTQCETHLEVLDCIFRNERWKE